jgi:hypothetical protein
MRQTSASIAIASKDPHDRDIDEPVLDTDTFLRPAAAAQFLQVTKGYLAKMRMNGGGEGPVWYRPEGTALVLYKKSDLLRWLGRPRRSTVRDADSSRSRGERQ